VGDFRRLTGPKCFPSLLKVTRQGHPFQPSAFFFVASCFVFQDFPFVSARVETEPFSSRETGARDPGLRIVDELEDRPQQ
jgi:hypothetical protein